MIYIALISFFIFSIVIGSFLNVIIFRYNTGLSFAKGRSKCFSCGETLQVLDLFPILSYIVSKGKCRHCKSPISLQYPLVELCTGILLTSIFYMYFFSAHASSFIGMYMFNSSHVFQVLLAHPWLQFVFLIIDLKIASILIVVGVYDMKHKIIPDGLIYIASAYALVKTILALVMFGGVSTLDVVYTSISGLLTALPFALLWLVSGGRWMGLGDAKLALVIGWALGLSNGFTAIIYSFWIGCIAVLGIMLLREFLNICADPKHILHVRLWKTKTIQRLTEYLPVLKLKSELPFGPYMIIGLYVVYFTGKTLFMI